MDVPSGCTKLKLFLDKHKILIVLIKFINLINSKARSLISTFFFPFSFYDFSHFVILLISTFFFGNSFIFDFNFL